MDAWVSYFIMNTYNTTDITLFFLNVSLLGKVEVV